MDAGRRRKLKATKKFIRLNSEKERECMLPKHL